MITKSEKWFQVLPHLRCSPDLAYSDCHLVPNMRKSRHIFADDERAIATVMCVLHALKYLSSEVGLNVLANRWENVTVWTGILVRNKHLVYQVRLVSFSFVFGPRTF